MCVWREMEIHVGVLRSMEGGREGGGRRLACILRGWLGGGRTGGDANDQKPHWPCPCACSEHTKTMALYLLLALTQPMACRRLFSSSHFASAACVVNLNSFLASLDDWTGPSVLCVLPSASALLLDSSECESGKSHFSKGWVVSLLLFSIWGECGRARKLKRGGEGRANGRF